MKLALVPVNVRVGNLENVQTHKAQISRAVKDGASIVVFPELSLLGYPLQDLLHRPDFPDRAMAQLDELQSWLVAEYPEIAVIVGTVVRVGSSALSPRGLANCGVFLHGERREIRAKTLIPYYDVFHESRYFDSSVFLHESYVGPIPFKDKKIGLLICEDSWSAMSLHGKKIHTLDPSSKLQSQGCDFLINISASPFERKKKKNRRDLIGQAAKKLSLPIAYVNHYGAQDELLFDGDAFVATGDGFLEKLEASSDILYWNLESTVKPKARLEDAELRDLSRMLVQGIRDYVKKNGFEKIVLGLSGGIDSALVAVLAAEAVGPKNVMALAMPSKFSSSHSVGDAEALADNLGIAFKHFPIKMAHATYLMALKPFFEGLGEDVTEENLQARLRGIAVMAFSNKFKALALATGNKSEFAMGYSTLYGDMCGALAPIGDLYKTEVYELSRFLNKQKEVIPINTFTKPPSAELKPNQTDQDSLPPYEILDVVLRAFIELELSPKEAHLFLKETMPKVSFDLVQKIFNTIRTTEYKRKQAPPILRVSSKAFGGGRVYPLTAWF